MSCVLRLLSDGSSEGMGFVSMGRNTQTVSLHWVKRRYRLRSSTLKTLELVRGQFCRPEEIDKWFYLTFSKSGDPLVPGGVRNHQGRYSGAGLGISAS